MAEDIEKIKEIKKNNEKLWMSIKGVVATGIGKTSSGATGIIVSVKKDTHRIRKKIPSMINDVPIEIQESGEIKAF